MRKAQLNLNMVVIGAIFIIILIVIVLMLSQQAPEERGEIQITDTQEYIDENNKTYYEVTTEYVDAPTTGEFELEEAIDVVIE
ncbi:MAG: hypothetical protein GY861_17035 [bacterium]|nr:hypothetical protein [bacterium]